MANIQHTQAGSANPLDTPPSIGAHYVNTATGQRWISKGTAAPSDWGKPLPGSPVEVPNSVMDWTVDPLLPSVVWSITGGGARSIVFPATEIPGLTIVELLIDNANGQETIIDIDAGGGLPILGRTRFVLYPDSRNYFRFACYVNAYGAATWQILDETALGMQANTVRFIPGSWETATLTPTPQTTLWNIDGNRTLTLPEIPLDQFPMFIELNVMFNAKYAGECVITIDPNGLPLNGHATLTIPADSAQLYKLACFLDNGIYFWSVVSVANLTG
ncbi:hypothetical protein [Pseudomonas sp. TMB3-21]